MIEIKYMRFIMMMFGERLLMLHVYFYMYVFLYVKHLQLASSQMASSD